VQILRNEPIGRESFSANPDMAQRALAHQLGDGVPAEPQVRRRLVGVEQFRQVNQLAHRRPARDD
jgi:hypothetical protein